ncbi:MAG: hypothetical protein K2J20_05090 [Bacilli bacterium]|nr:hypothetical protein [Bacilli bacterium]
MRKFKNKTLASAEITITDIINSLNDIHYELTSHETIEPDRGEELTLELTNLPYLRTVLI